MPLTQQQKAIINQASRTAIGKEYSSIKNNWASQLWLQRRNRYINDPIDRLKEDKKGSITPNDAHLRQYIAASSLTHCMDGWSFIGRAIEAHLRGDSDTSRHLGYYAELRAAMAFLASEGIGVFDKIHYIVDHKGKCREIPNPNKKGTHVITWESLEYWASSNVAADLLFSVIKPGGIPLKEWLDNFSMGTGIREIIADKWLKQWGLDLKMLYEDRDSRNFASYRPTAFTSPRALSINDALQSVNEFWNTFEPFESLRFAKLDRYLLKNSLEIYFRTSHPNGKSHKQAAKTYKLIIRNMLHNLAPGDLTSEEWLTFLTDTSNTSCAILLDAKGEAGPKDPNHHREVIARAALLLRIATGSCHEFLYSLTTTDKEKLQFWCSRIGEDRSLWQAANEPDQFIDLWADIKEALEELEDWKADPANYPNSYCTLWKESSDVVGMLGTCERICLWGVGV